MARLVVVDIFMTLCDPGTIVFANMTFLGHLRQQLETKGNKTLFSAITGPKRTLHGTGQV